MRRTIVALSITAVLAGGIPAAKASERDGTSGVLLLLLSKDAAAAEGEQEAKETTAITVRGMVCSSCSKAVRTALLKLDGVADARVDLKSETAFVRYEGRKVTPQQMVEAVRKAGYRASWPAR